MTASSVSSSVARQPSSAILSSQFDALNLSRALSRLERKLLSPNADRRLGRSSYERTKTAANIEYARDLLLHLEHSTSSIKVQSRKQASQNSLLQQRALIKRLNDRLYELSRQDDGAISSESSSDEELLGEDTMPSIFRNESEALPSSSLDRRNASHTETPSSLRSRLRPLPPAASETTGRSLFSNAPSAESLNPSGPALLEADSSTQAQLTSSLVQMASALKQSSLALSASLTEDNLTLSSTAAALDQNTDGMAVASKRMGMLRSMSEGRWWWSRMLLYAMIAGMWFLALGIVLLMPKLRW
ncbi:hypothetical protein MMC13_007949 [Lambiella insularis]|nr:hypothetical protein [Lambiella insularis]